MTKVKENFVPKSFEEIETIKSRLKEVKDEWLEKKPGKANVTYIGHNTIRQILDNAVKGITYWDFTILEQWREEVYAYNKETGQWYFDGYVYHVKGAIYIPGLGRREQYGSKVAVGGKDNQDSAYKAAASNCFNKCASLFGVGEDIYSKIIVEDETDKHSSHQQMHQQQRNFQNQQWNHNNTQSWNQQQSQYGWNQNQGQWNQQQGVQQTGNFNQGQQQAAPTAVDQNKQEVMQAIREVDQMMASGQPIETPFDVNVKEATPSEFTASQQGQAKPHNYSATTVQYSAPVTKDNQETNENTVKKDTNNQGTNPWQEQGVIKELQRYAAHKNRLSINNDDLMIPYLRDFFKDEEATTEYLTPENLKDFNDYLENISV